MSHGNDTVALLSQKDLAIMICNSTLANIKWYGIEYLSQRSANISDLCRSEEAKIVAYLFPFAYHSTDTGVFEKLNKLGFDPAVISALIRTAQNQANMTEEQYNTFVTKIRKNPIAREYIAASCEYSCQDEYLSQLSDKSRQNKEGIKDYFSSLHAAVTKPLLTMYKLSDFEDIINSRSRQGFSGC